MTSGSEAPHFSFSDILYVCLFFYTTEQNDLQITGNDVVSAHGDIR